MSWCCLQDASTAAGEAAQLYQEGEQAFADGRYHAAYQLHRQALLLREALQDTEGDQMRQADSLFAIGRSLWHLLQFKQSIEYLRGAILAREELLGIVHKDVADAHHWLAAALLSWHEVVDICSQSTDGQQKAAAAGAAVQATAAAEIRVQLAHTDQLAIAADLHLCGQALSLQGELSLAFRYHELAAMIRRRHVGAPPRPEMALLLAESLHECGVCACHSDDVPFLQEALRLREAHLDADDERCALTRSKLAEFEQHGWRQRKPVDMDWAAGDSVPGDQLLLQLQALAY